jgi:hypothetical protein
MDTQILKLEAPFDYIYCNGEVGKHIATYIVGESRIGEDGKYELETHSHPIVQYKDGAKGVVWNRAELTDCEVLCNEEDMRVDVRRFFTLCVHLARLKEDDPQKDDYTQAAMHAADEAEPLKEKLRRYGIGFKPYEGRSEEECAVFVGSCREGYYADVYDCPVFYYDIVEPTLEELAKRMTGEREFWERIFDHVVKVRYTPESSLAEDFVENL